MRLEDSTHPTSLGRRPTEEVSMDKNSAGVSPAALDHTQAFDNQSEVGVTEDDGTAVETRAAGAHDTSMERTGAFTNVPNDATQVQPAESIAGTPAKAKLTQLGDYKMVKKLGEGGMGAVFLANQLSLDRP